MYTRTTPLTRTRALQKSRRAPHAPTPSLRNSNALTEAVSGHSGLRLGRREAGAVAMNVGENRADDGAVEGLRAL